MSTKGNTMTEPTELDAARERLEKAAQRWSLNGPNARVSIKLGDIRAALTAWNTRPAPALDREGVVACIRDAADRGFEAGKAGAIHFRFPDIIARVDALLSASTVEG